MGLKMSAISSGRSPFKIVESGMCCRIPCQLFSHSVKFIVAAKLVEETIPIQPTVLYELIMLHASMN
jgi:hypothetical protein